MTHSKSPGKRASLVLAIFISPPVKRKSEEVSCRKHVSGVVTLIEGWCGAVISLGVLGGQLFGGTVLFLLCSE